MLLPIFFSWHRYFFLFCIINDIFIENFSAFFPLCLSSDITEVNSILTKLGISFLLILHSSQIGLSILSIKKWLFGKVHGVSSFFSSEIKLKILKPNNWLKIESSSIWKPRKLLHTPTIQFCLKAFIEKKIQFNNISTKITNVAYSCTCILKKIKRLQR